MRSPSQLRRTLQAPTLRVPSCSLRGRPRSGILTLPVGRRGSPRYPRRVATLPIVEIGHPTLRLRARDVRDDELGTAGLRRICDELVETMRAANGAGLAAPQVDVSLRIFAVGVADNPRYPYKPRLHQRVLVNPVVTPVSDGT